METEGLFARSRGMIIAFIAMTAFAVAEAYAAQVYKWMDHGGVTHYDQQPPEDSTVLVQVLDVPNSSAYPEGRSNYAKIIELAEKLERSRLERERLRLAKEQVRTASSSAVQATDRAHDPVVQYRFIAHPVYRHRGHHRFGHRYTSGRTKHRYHNHNYKRIKRHYQKYNGGRAAKYITAHRGSRSSAFKQRSFALR